MKHLDLMVHLIRQCVKGGIFEVKHVAGDANPADAASKPYISKPSLIRKVKAYMDVRDDLSPAVGNDILRLISNV